MEKKIKILGAEITKIHILMIAINEIIQQSNLNFDVYKKYGEFFYLTYFSYYNELIQAISRLQDDSGGSLSIVKILDKKKSKHKEILDHIKNDEVNEKIKTIRNKLGRAHLDREVLINLEEQKKLYESSKTELNDLAKYIKLLTDVLEIISDRPDVTYWHLKPNTSIRREIQELFNKLK